ncbi:MAG: hypothetical protein HY846_08655 [Nitrosomonadales bacterium]|nr:hypothetical protein [Nitrosomonadales bacterium]
MAALGEAAAAPGKLRLQKAGAIQANRTKGRKIMWCRKMWLAFFEIVGKMPPLRCTNVAANQVCLFVF